MAQIEDLIKSVKDAHLRSELEREVRRLKTGKRFGLVFEEHLPEATRVPSIPPHKGGHVAFIGSPNEELWLVDDVKGGEIRVSREGQERKVRATEVQTVRRFGEAVYPTLFAIDKVERAPDKPWHVLIQADNYHALQLLLYSHESKVDVIYIDPPYNTGARDWKYNNDYVDKNDNWRHSKWLSMMKRRLLLAFRLLKPTGTMVITIDDYEYHHLRCLLAHEFPGLKILGTLVIKTSPSGRPTVRGFRVNHEYAIFVAVNEATDIGTVPKSENQLSMFSEEDDQGKFAWVNLRKRGGANTRREARPRQYFPIFINGEAIRIPKMSWLKDRREWKVLERPKPGEQALYPIGDDGKERIWSLGYETLLESMNELRVKRSREGQPTVQRKLRLETGGSQPSTFWDKPEYSIVEHGTVLLEKILGASLSFPFPKSVYAVEDCLRIAGANKPDALILDFFAGSGTTLNAVARLNYQDQGKRQCILVTNNEVSENVSRDLEDKGAAPGDSRFELAGIARSVTWPRCKYVIRGKRDDGSPLSGSYVDGADLKDGFSENMEFFKLDFLDPHDVARGKAFEAILPILWMSAGSIGPRETSRREPPWFIPERNAYAVLLEESKLAEFRNAVRKNSHVTHIFIVTDSEDAFRDMAAQLDGFQTSMLYKSYLESFKINALRPNEI